MMKRTSTTGALAALATVALTITQPVFADTTPATSTATPTSVGAKSVLDNMSIGYLGQLFGPGIGDVSARARGADGSVSGDIFMRSLIGFGYKIDKQTSVGLNVNFDYRMVNGQDLKALDPELKFVKKYVNNGLTIQPELRATIPVTTAGKLNRITRLRSYNTISYDIPNTKINVGAYGILAGVIHQSGGATGGDYNMLAYGAPFASYNFSKVVAATLAYEMTAKQMPGNSITNWVSDGTDIQAGVNFTFGRVELNPYLQWTPTEALNSDTVSLGAYLSAKLL